jgi:hypothetical protein
LESINELELRNLLKRKLNPQELLTKIISAIGNSSMEWEDKRPFFSFLFLTQRHATLMAAMKEALDSKERIPYDMLMAMTGQALIQPKSAVIESVLKGLKKQDANEDVFASREWDKWDKRFGALRNELLEAKVKEQSQFKSNMVEKFEFLKNQRMNQEAGRVLRRMVELYPDDPELQKIKQNYDEDWARDVLAGHIAQLSDEKFDRTRTAPSSADDEMLRMFSSEGEKLCLENRNIATDLAIAFWFLEDPARAAEILAWAPPTASNDWLKAEFLTGARHFVEALEWLNVLEVKYIDDPESTFAVSYLRAQCLHALGQHSSALEIMQSIVRVRSNYRSAHALILEWTAGVSWE